MSRASNTFKASDITTTPIKLKYNTAYSSSNINSSGIKSSIGINGSVTITGSISQETINYRGIKQLYYQNYLTSSLLNSSSYFDPNQQSTACSGSSEYEDRYFPTASNSQIFTIAIPPIVFGEQISRNSLVISPADASSYRIIDDGNGNLIDIINNNAKVGNVIYSQGLLIITNQSYTSSFTLDTNLPSITIGSQVWMSSNLDVTTYANGDLIPQASSSAQWQSYASAGTGAWCWYNFDVNNSVYGKLYNGFAVNSSKLLAPAGWKIPSTNDFRILSSSVSNNGGALKSTDIGTYWQTPNTGATNSSGFNATGSGYMNLSGNPLQIQTNSNLYTSDYNSANPYAMVLSYDSTTIAFNTFDAKSGLSVRCLRYL